MAGRITLKWLQENWSKTENMVSMRDGTRLYTAAYQRKGLDCRRPVMLLRTPFSLKPYGKGFSRRLRFKLSNYVRNDYIIIFQNVRGTYLSEGELENVRGGDGEALDTYDTAEWIVSETLCDGNIGVQGMSYPGFYATNAAMSGHPAIKAVSPQAPVTDWFMGDDLHHNGALLLADTCGFGNFFFKKRPAPSGRSLPCRPVTDGSLYDFYRGKVIADILKPYLKRKESFWQDIVAHPDYDRFWQERNAAARLRDVRPAVLIVGGLFDAEDNYGPLECWRRINSQSPATESYLCLGPWSHGSWLEEGFDRLGSSLMGNGLTDYYLDDVEYPFFAHYLEGRGGAPSHRVTVIPSAGEDAENGRRMASEVVLKRDSWPLEGLSCRKMYLRADKRLKETIPEEGNISYVSDPFSPVPYLDSIEPWISRDYMAADQRFTSRRKDVAVFMGQRLKSSVKACGAVHVHLEVTVSGDDADFIVKLVDVRPDGYRMLVRSGIMPARYREGFSEGKALVPGEKTSIDFTLNDIAHEFLPCHKLMVQVQSSCFPLYAMNPQKFVRNQYTATEYRSATITIHSGSYIEVPVTEV